MGRREFVGGTFEPPPNRKFPGNSLTGGVQSMVPPVREFPGKIHTGAAETRKTHMSESAKPCFSELGLTSERISREYSHRCGHIWRATGHENLSSKDQKSEKQGSEIRYPRVRNLRSKG